MASETLMPDALLDNANYSSGAVTDIDDDPDSPDGLWLGWDGNGNTACRVSFPTPSGNPTVGADLQEFRVLIRKTLVAGNDTDWSLELWENGVQDSVLATGTTTSLVGEVVSGTWNANALGTADGSLVECLLLQTNGGSGNVANRRGIEVGAVEWNVEYDVVDESSSSSPSSGSSSSVSSQSSASSSSVSSVSSHSSSSQSSLSSSSSSSLSSSSSQSGILFPVVFQVVSVV